MTVGTVNRPRILIADDQADVLTALRLLLKTEGYGVVVARSPVEVLRLVETEACDLLLVDMNYARDTTSGAEGLALIERIHQLVPELPVVVMTAWATIDLAVEAVRRGARDFLQKPWDNRRLLATLRTQLELSRALLSEQRLEHENKLLGAHSPMMLVAHSPAMQCLLELVERIGPSDANVLITGEHGTGKGVIAREVHARSRRAARPLLTVNVGALAEGLFESELFGHVAGAFTDARSAREGRFALADGGTLFLDEIGNLPHGLQAKLLRAIETGEFESVGSSLTRRVNVRLLTATNAELGAEVRAGTFREDLYYRLNTVELRLPPLRERREDIVPLAEHFLATNVARYGRAGLVLSTGAMDTLRRCSWPGNVRQLEHSVERAVLLARGAEIEPADFGLSTPRSGSGLLDDMTLEEVEQALIRKALARSSGKVSEAAAALGLSRSALYRRLVKYGFAREESGVCS
ncbi:MAG: sigma-54-dependent transcriptional regulator [Pirellulales bacterium]